MQRIHFNTTFFYYLDMGNVTQKTPAELMRERLEMLLNYHRMVVCPDAENLARAVKELRQDAIDEAA